MQGLESLLVVALVAALAPMIAAALPGPRVPQVVILILAGVLIGPHVLGLADTTGIKLLSNVGLGFLFLLAGYGPGAADAGGIVGAARAAGEPGAAYDDAADDHGAPPAG